MNILNNEDVLSELILTQLHGEGEILILTRSQIVAAVIFGQIIDRLITTGSLDHGVISEVVIEVFSVAFDSVCILQIEINYVIFLLILLRTLIEQNLHLDITPSDRFVGLG